MTEATPTGLTHRGAVRYWLEALGGAAPASVNGQAADMVEGANLSSAIAI